MTYINPGQFQQPVGTSVTRTTVRSATRCAVILVVGFLIAIPAFIGMLFGILGGLTGAMDMAAGILVIVAGRIAENDRRANRVPSAGAGSGGERGLGWFFSLAVLLLITALIYGIAQMPTKE